MTRPSAPAVITAGCFLTWAAAAGGAAAVTGDWYFTAAAAGCVLAAGLCARLLWTITDADPAHAPLPRKWTAADWAEVAEFERTEK